jgi:hypothetical protein
MKWAGYPLSYACALPSNIFAARNRLNQILWMAGDPE